MLKKHLSLFAPLTKIDEPKRLIYGVATAEAPDRDGEICDYASTKPYYKKWSDDFQRATDGRSCGNLRAMHGRTAAGKIESIAFNDREKQIEIRAHVVDDDEWDKVRHGVYTGFSQGGGYVKRWPDPDHPELTRYTANPSEISLVDAPCLPDASFEIVKADGSRELRKFARAKNAKPAAAESDDDDAQDLRAQLAAMDARFTGIEDRLNALERQDKSSGKDNLEKEEETEEQSAPRKKSDESGYDEDDESKAEAFAEKLAKALHGLTPALEKLGARITSLEAQPMPMVAPPRLARCAAPEKSQDGAQRLHGEPNEDLFAKFAHMSDQERSLFMIRLAQMRPSSG